MSARDYSSILFPPEEVARLGSQYLHFIQENRGNGITIGITEIDEHFYPLMMTELMSIIARPGNGKTGLMVYMARRRAKQLREQGVTDRVVPYITLEQSIEELNAFNLAAESKPNVSITRMVRGELTEAEWGTIHRAAVQRQFMPLWNIGYSSMGGKKQIAVDLDAIDGALGLIAAERKIDVVFVDYLQRMPTSAETETSKAVAVSNNLDGLKNLALKYRCPVVVGVQAKREVDDKADKVPGAADGQWTSNIEQTSDRVITLMRPAKYFAEGEEIPGMPGKRVRGKNQLIMSIEKQKLGDVGISVWTKFQPEYNIFDTMEGNQ